MYGPAGCKMKGLGLNFLSVIQLEANKLGEQLTL